MDRAIAALSRVNGALARGALGLAGLGLVVMTVIVAAQVFMRYGMGESLHWVEPAAILLMSWFIFLGAAVGVQENFHMGFEVLIYVLPARFGIVLHLISDVAVFLFSVAMGVYGWQLMARTWGSSIPIIGLPGGFTYMPLFAGGVLMALFMLEQILKRLFASVPEAAPDADAILQSEV